MDISEARLAEVAPGLAGVARGEEAAVGSGPDAIAFGVEGVDAKCFEGVRDLAPGGAGVGGLIDAVRVGRCGGRRANVCEEKQGESREKPAP